MLGEVCQERRFPYSLCKEYRGWVQKYSSFLQVVKFILFGCILSLNSATLNFVEFNRRLGKVDTRNAGPETTKNDGLYEIAVLAIRVQLGGSRGSI